MTRVWPSLLLAYALTVAGRTLLRDLFRSPIDPTDED